MSRKLLTERVRSEGASQDAILQLAGGQVPAT
jgi:hypothetical protein